MCCLAYAVGGPDFLRSLWSRVGGRGVRVVGRGGNGAVESLVGCCPCGPSPPGKVSDDFSEDLCEEEKNVCLIYDHVWIGLGAFF